MSFWMENEEDKALYHSDQQKISFKIYNAHKTTKYE